MIKAIFLDMDDTLIVNQVLFDHARLLLRNYLKDFGIKPEEVEEAYARIDKELFKIYGRSAKRYPATFEAILKEFVPNADEDMVKEVRERANTVFNTIAGLKPGAAEAIELLATHYPGVPLYIVTAGDESIQKSRLPHIPFMDKITDVMIVDKKDVDTYKAALAKWDLKPEEVVMVGDSLGSDVIPAVAAGLWAVWLDTYNSPLLETKTGFPAERAYKYASLLDMVVAMIKERDRLDKSRTISPARAAVAAYPAAPAL